jgi:hypothetical protein
MAMSSALKSLVNNALIKSANNFTGSPQGHKQLRLIRKAHVTD